MSPSRPPGPTDSPARAFLRVGLPNLAQKLYRYATSTLGLAAVDAERAEVVEAVDLVNTLVEKSLEGTLSWTLPEHATDEEIVAYACNKLYGMRSTLRRKAAFTLHDDDALAELADEAPRALDLLVGQSEIAEVTRAFEHDAEASVYLRETIAGKTRAEIMAALGCTADRADVVRQRIVRGMAALRATMNDHTEPEPRRSGVRGTYHEPQATEERQGAAREPLRGAGGARGRR